MAQLTKDEIFDLIKNNPDEYNEWKSKQEEEIDLSELDFSHISLENINFEDADLNACSFSDSHLVNVNFDNTDLTTAEFTRAKVEECDFSNALLTGADLSYASITYSNFTDSDMAGCVFQETDLTNSDLAGSYNLSACRFDEDTIWPDPEMLPEDFDSSYTADIASLEDDEESDNMDY